MMKVYIPSSCSPEAVTYLKAQGFEVISGTGTRAEQLLAIAPLADAVMARIEQYPEGFLTHASRLKVIARHGVGVDNLPVKEAEEKGIWVTNAPYSNCDTVAESTIGMLMSVAMRLGDSDRMMREGRFSDRGILHKELRGKRIAVLGYGKIGSRVARMAHDGLGMEVVVYDHHSTQKDIPSSYRIAPTWQEAIQGADVVTLHMPGNPSLVHMFDEKAFSSMKDGAIFLNLARGSLVDEKALCGALESGKLWGAAIDVYEKEPLADESPLLKAPHLLLSPHNASHTKESMDRMAMDAALNIVDVLTNKTPRTPVNHPSHPRNMG